MSEKQCGTCHKACDCREAEFAEYRRTAEIRVKVGIDSLLARDKYCHALEAALKDATDALIHYSKIADDDGAAGRDRRDVARAALESIRKRGL